MSARTRKLRKVKLANVSFSAARSCLTRRRLVVMAGVSCVLLLIAAVCLWSGTQSDKVDISADQLDEDFNRIGLGPLGVPETARISPVDAHPAKEESSNHHDWHVASRAGEVDHAVVENSVVDGRQVIFPESVETDGPLFPEDPLSAPIGRIASPVIQPTQFQTRAIQTRAAPSGPTWLTGDIEFVDEQPR